MISPNLVFGVHESDLCPAGLRGDALDPGDMLEVRHDGPVLGKKIY